MPLTSRVRLRLTGSALPTALATGTLGALVSFAGSWIPAIWSDEVASINSAERPLRSLISMSRNVDAVHTVYYSMLHFWVAAFGSSALSIRLPSSIAVGIMVAGVVVLVWRLSTPGVAVVAGAVTILLPRTSDMGGEARSYALSAAVAVWLTVFLVELLARRTMSWWPWLAYAVAVATSVYVFLYLLLLVVAHGVYVVLTTRDKGVWVRWLTAASVGAVLCAPVIWLAVQQKGQLSFLERRTPPGPQSWLVDPWFASPWVAAVAWILLLLAVTVAVVRYKQTQHVSRLALLVVLWTALPTIVLLVIDLISRSYVPRYLTFATPAVAILIALGLAAVRWRWVAVLGFAALLAAAIPVDVAQRGVRAWQSDWNRASDYIRQQSSPGDAFYFGSVHARGQYRAYPQDFVGLRDVGLWVPYDRVAGLWDVTYSTAHLRPQLAGVTVLWLIEDADQRSRDIATLATDGFQPTATARFYGTVIYKLTLTSVP